MKGFQHEPGEASMILWHFTAFCVSARVQFFNKAQSFLLTFATRDSKLLTGAPVQLQHLLKFRQTHLGDAKPQTRRQQREQQQHPRAHVAAQPRASSTDRAFMDARESLSAQHCARGDSGSPCGTARSWTARPHCGLSSRDIRRRRRRRTKKKKKAVPLKTN